MRATTSSQKVLKQLDNLESALSGIRHNMVTENTNQHATMDANQQQQGYSYLLSEISTMKQSMGSMMDMVVSEIDGIKREMYLDFGQNQKMIMNDLERMKQNQTNLEEKFVKLEQEHYQAEK